MTREEAIVQWLVAMADTLVDDYDVIDLLVALTDRCVNLLAVSGAGVMLASPNGDLQVVAASSEKTHFLELFQLQAEEGPCLDAFRSGEAIIHQDLSTRTDRWPKFAPAAIAAGYASVHALPLRLREVTIGGLNLFCVESSPIDDRDVIVARAFAELATISVLQHRSAIEARNLNEQLSGALASRIVIEQAKGVTAERLGVDMNEAFVRLRTYARNNNRRLTDVAQAAIDNTIGPRELQSPPTAILKSGTGHVAHCFSRHLHPRRRASTQRVRRQTPFRGQSGLSEGLCNRRDLRIRG